MIIEIKVIENNGDWNRTSQFESAITVDTDKVKIIQDLLNVAYMTDRKCQPEAVYDNDGNILFDDNGNIVRKINFKRKRNVVLGYLTDSVFYTYDGNDENGAELKKLDAAVTYIVAINKGEPIKVYNADNTGYKLAFETV